jgi:hypothetical protein
MRVEAAARTAVRVGDEPEERSMNRNGIISFKPQALRFRQRKRVRRG